MRNFPRSRNLVFVGIGLVSLVLWCVFLSIPSTAQNSVQGNAPLPSLPERVLQDQIPRHLPLKVKVKNLEKVKDLQNEEWLRDLEIEITNTSSKPIYFLSLALYLPEVKSSAGYPIVFPLRYGRMDLIDFDEPLQPGDVPIQPEGIHILKVPASDLRGWEVFATESNLLRSAPKKIRLIFQSLNFGDKTGFSTTGGIAIPNPPKNRSSGNSCEDGENRSKAAIASANAQLNYSTDIFLHHPFNSSLFSFTKIKSLTSESSYQSNLCCPGTTCSVCEGQQV